MQQVLGLQYLFIKKNFFRVLIFWKKIYFDAKITVNKYLDNISNKSLSVYDRLFFKVTA